MISGPPNDGRFAGRIASASTLAAGACVGVASFVYYYSQRLTTAHYDAKAHLVVARRIVDSVSPGYEQMGANWLPLIHLVYLPLVLNDPQYRSAVLPSMVSVCAFALSGWLLYRIAARSTGSTAAGIFAAAILIANANLEYLQSCPLTEPLSILLLLLTVDSLMRWRSRALEGRKASDSIHGSNVGSLPWETAVWATLGALCRYEGFYVYGGILLLLVYDCWTGSIPRKRAAQIAAVYAGVFAVPVLAHFGFIYGRLGDSFFQRVARGNPAPYITYRRPALSVLYHLGELVQITAVVPLVAAFVGVGCVLARRAATRQYLPLFLLWIPSLTNISALYWGLIYRVRYSVLLVPAIAIFSALLVSEVARRRVLIAGCLVVMGMPWLSWQFPHEWRYHALRTGPGVLILPVAALILLCAGVTKRSRWPLLALCILAMQVPALEGEARPILEETREHAFIEPERQQILDYLRLNYDGTRILIDMGKLAPLAYDSQLPLKNFVYEEGGGHKWQRALQAPESEVGWICAEKGDEVWEWLRIDPRRASGYSLALQTDNFLLYRPKSTSDGSPPVIGSAR